ncbi:hypothetical protein NC797_18165 [Aquibacillus sp. 3ASR75-11]|uniref:Uncharacterized protein n=1 Tax=Terrihalobacillus insolitus TaxID=2950438 RepID=A0A9X3WY25_9BACI|nr:hypothetical protein [Terrihalobacillus insolitus]MDC3426376.1 hypothetical protein [Terrihalobacillus insolitus]
MLLEADIIDAMLGIGITGQLRESYRSVIETIKPILPQRKSRKRIHCWRF